MKTTYLFFFFFLMQLISMSCVFNSETKINQVNQIPDIYPDYNGITIPVNIAPLNFLLRGDFVDSKAVFRGNSGYFFTIKGDDYKFRIPGSRWRRLLRENVNGRIQVDILVRKDSKEWQQFQPLFIQVSGERIDRYLVYRLIKQPYKVMGQMGIYQRDLESFIEKEVLQNRDSKNCFNCHNFHQYNPERMFIHARAKNGPAMILDNKTGELERIDSRTHMNSSPASYSMWHPDGNRIAFSANKVFQFFHGFGERRDVMDISSDIFIYELDSDRVITSKALSDTEWMETQPAWSADGQYLYFSRCKQQNKKAEVNEIYDRIRYDLVRTSFDAKTGPGDSVETVLTAVGAGGSVSFPRISPDNRFIAISIAPYGTFPVTNRNSDIALYDLLNKEMIDCSVINSTESDSYHSWSSSARWIVFSSKRDNGLYARPYICYIRESGQPEKAFLLPQKDPAFYDSFLWTYNVPEFALNEIGHKAGDFLKRMAKSSPVRKAVGVGGEHIKQEDGNDNAMFDP